MAPLFPAAKAVSMPGGWGLCEDRAAQQVWVDSTADPGPLKSAWLGRGVGARVPQVTCLASLEQDVVTPLASARRRDKRAAGAAERVDDLDSARA